MAIASKSQLLTSDESKNRAKKNYLEDIFIWKISDELKLTAKEEKSFSEIIKNLNQKKTDLNRKIQTELEALNSKAADVQLKKYRQLLQEYNQLTITEFDSVKKIFEAQKFIQYLKLKNELTNKMKSILAGEHSDSSKSSESSSDKKLPLPRVIIEK